MKKLFLFAALLCAGLPLTACSDRTAPDPEASEVPSPEISDAAPLPTLPQNGEDETPETKNEPPMSERQPDEAPPAAPAEAEYVMTTVDGLNVRAGRGTSFAVLGSLEKGVLMPVYGREDGWVETKYRGKSAFLSERYCRTQFLKKGGEDVERVVEEGCLQLGVPYVYGAVRYHDGRGNLLKNFTAEAFDCSSLMQYIFYRGERVLLDVTTRTQIKQGTHVREEDLRRGDLLFFTNAARKEKTGIERVGHVALYLGDNYILHTASDYAKIEQISAARREYFLEARRVL